MDAPHHKFRPLEHLALVSAGTRAAPALTLRLIALTLLLIWSNGPTMLVSIKQFYSTEILDRSAIFLYFSVSLAMNAPNSA